jgi:two-component system LytT family response regulator
MIVDNEPLARAAIRSLVARDPGLETAGDAASGRVVVKSGSRMTVLAAAEIGWIEAADNYVEIHTAARTHLVRQTMREMEGQLDARRFIRVHRSAIVNLDHVREIRGDPHGDGIAVLSTGGTVRISRSRRDAVGRALEQQALSGGGK